MGTRTSDAVHTQEEDEDNREIDDSGSQVSFNNSTLKNEAHANTENGYPDQFGAAKTLNKTFGGIQQPREFMAITISDKQPGTTRVLGSGTTLWKLEAYYEGHSRQRETARVSTST